MQIVCKPAHELIQILGSGHYLWQPGGSGKNVGHFQLIVAYSQTGEVLDMPKAKQDLGIFLGGMILTSYTCTTFFQRIGAGKLKMEGG